MKVNLYIYLCVSSVNEKFKISFHLNCSGTVITWVGILLKLDIRSLASIPMIKFHKSALEESSGRRV